MRKIALKTRQLQSKHSCQANLFQNKTTIPVQTRNNQILEEAPLDGAGHDAIVVLDGQADVEDLKE